MICVIRFVLLSAFGFGLVFLQDYVDYIDDDAEEITARPILDDDIHHDAEEIKAILVGIKSEIREGLRHLMAFGGSYCPPGFVYLPKVDRCYKILDGRSAWSSASQKCQDQFHGAHLAAIINENQNNAIKWLIKSELSKNPSMDCRSRHYLDGGNRFWTGGQRLNPSNCSSEFVWKLPDDNPLPMNFTNWDAGEPNCYAGVIESCLEIWPNRHLWNDYICAAEICSICEYDPNFH